MIEIVPIETPSLGDRSYLVHDGNVAFVVDPQRDIDRVTGLVDAMGVDVRHVFETHIHNDYVTGGLILADACGAAYHVNGADPVSFDRTPVADRDVVEISAGLAVQALATPGHTFNHTSYVVLADGSPCAVFTGGSLLYGSTGRPDLLGPDHTDALVRAQYSSARRLAHQLPDATEVFPTHGFGSFCSATQSDATSSTIGIEKRVNPALTYDEQAFVTDTLAGLDAFPAYYAHMGGRNLTGPRAPDLSRPVRADAGEVRARIAAGEWVVDLRSRTAFAAGHVPGTFTFGLDGLFATYLGWLMPWGTPVTLLGETPEQIAEAQRELVRVGIERPAAMATGTPDQWTGGAPLDRMRLVTYPDVRAADRDVVLLDVRRRLEHAERHIAGAVHIPLHELLARMDEVPEGEVWVYCRSGYRATLAASMLRAAGREAVAVDDEFDNVARSGRALAGSGGDLRTPD